ncbi:chemotaxis protein CheA [Heliorestis acidaminivorans]|uniref:Chemotaxis protein CheA n=1 Tax=Heliorestis acidaminivorans TaxID=553427 RepID=A0A6I0FA12_9FIRM|nr:chemotaxis protein CheA [Heliorestis acidaminivorans]KAB2954378.1 chemotaxis protein CheA [Heliorestis acidaminivorans]
MDMSQYLDMFLEESREHLQTLNQKILELEDNPHNVAVLDEIFRSAHTLKGMSATMGFEGIAELTHEMENVLSNLRGSPSAVTTKVVDLLFKCLDSLENMVDAIVSGGDNKGNGEELIQLLRLAGTGELDREEKKVKKIIEPKENLTKILQEEEERENQQNEELLASFNINQYDLTILREADRKQLQAYHINVQLDASCVMKAARTFMVFRNLEEAGEIIKSVPTAQELEEEKFDRTFQVVVVTPDSKEEVIKTLESIAEVEVLSITDINIDEVQTQKGQELSKDEFLDNAVAVEEKLEVVHIEDKRDSQKQEIKTATGKETVKKTKISPTVRVDIERLDNLMNLVGELVISKTRLEQISTTSDLAELNETIEHIDRITTDLQTVVMKVRMVPIEQVFNRFPRMVRDLAKELGKEINLIIEGKETELDRTVIDEIGDPLVHLIRNAIDHGVEQPEVRRQMNKPVEAVLRLVAKHEGNNVVIEVEDDGRGIDAGKLKNKAIQKGLITAKEAEQLDEQGAVNLIWMAGFTTAEQVSDISGRGVGLDAVRTKIESLSGSVEIETQINKGTKFKIRLPLTLAIIQALLVNVGDEIYAIPLGAIDETTSIEQGHIKKVQNQEVVLLRGQVLPLVRLDQVLEVPRAGTHTEELYVVVVRKGEKKAGLIVDSLIGQQEIVIKSPGKLLQGICGIAGAAILGNGQVSLILDVGTLL